MTNESIEKRFESLEEEIRKIRDNHLHHLSEDVAVLKAQLESIVWALKLIVGTSMASLITGAIGLMANQ